MAILYELPEVAGIYLLIGLLAVIAFTFTLLAHALNVSVFGTHPFGSLARVIENTIVAGCQDGIDHLEHYALRFENLIIDTLGLFLGILLLPFLGIRAALAYLWHSLVKPLVGSANGLVRTLANEALATAKAAERSIVREVGRLDAKITLTAAALYQTITREWRIALRDAGIETWRGIDSLVRDLRAEFEARLKGIEGTANTVTGTLDAATAETIRLISEAENATAAELGDLLRGLNPAEIGSLIASVPLLATLVQTIASEAGLDSASCRAKVKNICGTDPSLWGNLLGGLVAMEVAFNLRELVEFGNEMVRLLEPEIRAIEAA